MHTRQLIPNLLSPALHRRIRLYPLGSARSLSAMAAKRVLVPIANGSEEIEAVTIIDTLRRAGAEVTVASVEPGLEVTCSRKVKLVADASIQDAAQGQYDCIALPVRAEDDDRLMCAWRTRLHVSTTTAFSLRCGGGWCCCLAQGTQGRSGPVPEGTPVPWASGFTRAPGCRAACRVPRGCVTAPC